MWGRLHGDADRLRSLVVGQNHDGRLEVFGAASNDSLWHTWQTAPSNGWTGWHPCHNANDRLRTLAVGRNHDGRLELFGIAADESVWHSWQTTPSGGWSGWHPFHAGSDRLRSLVVGQNHDGRLEVFGAASNDSLWHTWQTAPSNGWTGWHPCHNANDRLRTLAVGRNHDGRLELFGIAADESVWHSWQTTPSGGWSGWQRFEAERPIQSIEVGRNSDGRLEAFAVGTDDSLWHRWQETRGGGWQPRAPTRQTVRVPGFTPEQHGLDFPNSFTFAASLTVTGLGNVPIASLSYGLCGGMAFAVRDLWEAGLAPPRTRGAIPTPPSPIWNYIASRLAHSLDTITIERNLEYSDPTLADHDVLIGRMGRARMMIEHEWPLVREDIDNNRLSPLSLIRTKSLNVLDLMNLNHQVLAYGYEIDGSVVTLQLWDPNAPTATSTLSFDTSDPAHTTQVTYGEGASIPNNSTLMFFRTTSYVATNPGSISVTPAWDAGLVSSDVPAPMIAGDPMHVRVTMLNRGGVAWTRGNNYRLGPQGPQDNNLWGISRVDLPRDVSPGATVTFEFDVTPQTHGTLNFQWQMLIETLRWFGDTTPPLAVVVQR